MATTTQTITIGSILLLIATGLIVVVNMDFGLKIDISKNQTNFYIYNNESTEAGNWTLSGTETWKMYINGNPYTISTSKITNTLLGNNKTKIDRTSTYKNTVSGVTYTSTIIDTYIFDGKVKDIEQFPIQHTINITCNNCSYRYIYNLTSPRMRIEYDKPDSESNNLLIYNTVGNRIINIRMFDPLWNVSGNLTPNTPSLDPDVAYVNSTLNCSVYANMANFTNISYTPGTNYTVYFWYFKNNVQISRYNSLQVYNTTPIVAYARLGVTERLTKGDVWHCRVRMATSIDTSPILISNYVTIANTAPGITLTNPLDNSTAYITNVDPVTLRWVSSDLENDTIQYEVYGE